MRTISRLYNYLCSPLLIYTYGFLIMAWSNSYLFEASHWRGFLPFFALVFFSTFFIPVLTLLLLRQTNLIPSLALHTRRERIIPIFVVAVLYSAFYFHLKNLPTTPHAYSTFLLGGLITLFICLFINSFYRISLHGAAMSCLMMAMFLFYLSGQSDHLRSTVGNQVISVNFLLVPVVLLNALGLLTTIRIKLGAEEFREGLAGWLVGATGALLAAI